MRRRVVRDLGTIAGIAVILAGVVGLNIYYRLGGLQAKFIQIRKNAEVATAKQGVELLNWELLQKTKGSLRSGPTFDKELIARAKEGRRSNLMGFMTPIDQIRDVSHFMLLPMPIECYFCKMPPMRDVMLVRMAEGDVTNIMEEPVLVTGGLNLHEGPKQKFFYSMADSGLRAGDTGKPLTTKSISAEHRTQVYKEGGKLMQEQDAAGGAPPEGELLPGVDSEPTVPVPTPPAGATAAEATTPPPAPAQ